MRVMHVVGARPNFMKVAPIMREMRRFPNLFEQFLVHTGQHYDYAMSTAFFEQLEMPDPDEFLGVGPGSHAQQTARVMTSFETVVLRHRPDWVVVVGDVNSTVACAMVCAKLGIKVAHVEAGLRSRDRTMPEEINRIVTDHLSDLLFTPSPDANENLLNEGARPEQIRLVGNVMIDSLVKMMPRVLSCDVLSRLGVETGKFALVTLHRPGNVDSEESLEDLLVRLRQLADILPVIFPVHPRTRARIGDDRIASMKGLSILGPLDYISFVAAMRAARVVITDSGGVQEETTFLGVPCLTVRPNTERPITIACGTNRLIAASGMTAAVREILSQERPLPRRPELWDGRTAERIVACLAQECDAAGIQANIAAAAGHGAFLQA